MKLGYRLRLDIHIKCGKINKILKNSKNNFKQIS